eukprot:scaffold9726_cov119-Isochrysis_galbana.AAC.10
MLPAQVVPRHLDSCVDALNQNMNVSAPTISQRAAVAALSADARPELLSHVQRCEPFRPALHGLMSARARDKFKLKLRRRLKPQGQA